VTGPVDVLNGCPEGEGGALREDLREACLDALKVPRESARAWAERFSWQAASEEFASHLHPRKPEPSLAPAV
jgi:hypothetical protein